MLNYLCVICCVVPRVFSIKVYVWNENVAVIVLANRAEIEIGPMNENRFKASIRDKVSINAVLQRTSILITNGWVPLARNNAQ